MFLSQPVPHCVVSTRGLLNLSDRQGDFQGRDFTPSVLFLWTQQTLWLYNWSPHLDVSTPPQFRADTPAFVLNIHLVVLFILVLGPTWCQVSVI